MHRIFGIDDILAEIFKYTELYKLYPCVFVNNQWCKVTMRILWQAPFIPNCFPQPDEKAWKFLKLLARTYLLCLTKDKYEFLENEGLPLPPASPPKFEYPTFMKVLDFSFIYYVADSWIIDENVLEENKIYYQKILRKTLIENLIEQAKNIQFIHLDGNIQAPDLPILNKDTQSLQDLRRLFIHSQINEEIFVKNISAFVKQISEIVKKVEHITIRADAYRDDQEDEAKALAELIEVSSSLKFLEIIGYRTVPEIFKSLLKQSNSLVNLSLKEIDFKQLNQETIESWVPFWFVLKKLQKFTFRKNGNFNQDAVPLIIKIIKSTDMNLQYLELSMIPLTLENRSEIISIIVQFCPNLIHLYIRTLSNSEIESILINCQKLRVLKFYTENNFYEANFTEIAENLPPSLNILNIIITTKYYFPFYDSFKSFIDKLNSNNKLKILNVIKAGYYFQVDDESKQMLMERGIRLNNFNFIRPY
ncbi:RNI-like protein [Gigaspora margarita]|uniref:RNI-like protein n=1 Tax=Gigaspora margarita TaxID=4874 RepID=A0A8H4B563_GIGMA|nr:RNI-like protein [Gigaspora margarita]